MKKKTENDERIYNGIYNICRLGRLRCHMYANYNNITRKQNKRKHLKNYYFTPGLCTSCKNYSYYGKKEEKSLFYYLKETNVDECDCRCFCAEM